jgi:hypothetical protein
MMWICRRDGFLPMNIWIDNERSYKKTGQQRRVLFQKNLKREICNDFGTITLDGHIVKSSMKHNELSLIDLDKLRTFVLNNRHVLECLSDTEISCCQALDLLIKSSSVTKEDLQKQEMALQEKLKSYDL